MIYISDPTFYLYIVATIELTLLYCYLKKGRRLILALLVFSFCLCAGLRHAELPDTPEYTSLFNSMPVWPFFQNDSRYEPGFILLAKAVKSIQGGHHVFFFVVALINSILMLYAFSLLRINLALGWLAYVSFHGLYFNFVFIRSGLATSFFVLGVALMCVGFKKRSLFALVAAPLFHKSTSVYLIGIGLPLLLRRLPRSGLAYLVFGAIFFYFFRFTQNVMEGTLAFIVNFDEFRSYRIYIDNIKLSDGYSWRFIWTSFVVASIALVAPRFPNDSMLISLSVSGLIITSLFSSFLWVDRISDTFNIFGPICLAAALSNCIPSYNRTCLMVLLSVNTVLGFAFASRILTKFVYS